MRYIREDLAGDLGGQVQFDIICGTSVGAIHACFFAATADIADKQGRILVDRWESFVLEEMVSFGVTEFMRAPATLLGSGHIEEVEGQRHLGGIVQTQQLERVVRRLIPWHRIGPNIRDGKLESLSVTATDIGSGKTVVFLQSARDKPAANWSKDPFVRAQSVTIGAEHALASAALPILFPAICVGERFFCDGGLRQNTPLSPALRLGADKVLVIGLRQQPAAAADVPEESMPFPGAAFLVGKILDAFLLDHIDYDLDRLRRFNAVIEAVRAVGSPEHQARFDEVVTNMRGAPYRTIGEYMIRPSGDLGEIAGHVARSGRFKGSGGGAGIQLLRRLATARGADEADLLSYILFDGLYAAEVARMGYEDARAHHDELAKFLGDAVVREWLRARATRSSASRVRTAIRVAEGLLHQAELRAATAAGGQRLGQLGFRMRGDGPQAADAPLGTVAGALAGPRAAHRRDLRRHRLGCFRSFSRVRSGHHRDITGHVLGVEDPAAIHAGDGVNGRPGDHRHVRRARERQRGADPVLVDLQIRDRDRQVVAVLQHQVRFLSEGFRHHHTRPAGVEMQRRRPLFQERQKSLLLRGAFGIHPRS
jgi:NTE family protein